MRLSNIEPSKRAAIVENARVRAAREKSGLNGLEKQLTEKICANNAARRTGDDPPWTDQEIREIREKINQIKAREKIK